MQGASFIVYFCSLRVHRDFGGYIISWLWLVINICAHISSAGAAPAEVFAEDRIDHLPSLAKLDRPQAAGYVAGLFYWYVSPVNNNADAPVIIWTSGGPGTSSLYGFFKENGPYEVRAQPARENAQPVRAKSKPTPQLQLIVAQTHADWSQFAHYLVIDQPLGVGMSFADKAKYPQDPQQGNAQYLQAIIAFFKRYPHLAQRDIYLAGESYGGTYIALLAKSIQQQKAVKISLKGLIVVSGWVDPVTQYQALPDFAYQHKLINASQYRFAQDLAKQCASCEPQQQDCYQQCEKIDNYLRRVSGRDLHHILRDQAPANDWQKGPWVRYLNQAAVRKALHITNASRYRPMTNIWDNYGRKQLASTRSIYGELLKNKMKLLVISGAADASPSGIAGTGAWLQALFGTLQHKPRHQVSKVVQQVQLTATAQWVQVTGAGHVVPEDYPQVWQQVRDFVVRSK